MNPKKDLDKADEAPAKAGPELKSPKGSINRIIGAQFLGGAWIAADGSLLNDKEAQQAHRAMDKAAADAAAKARLGGSE